MSMEMRVASAEYEINEWSCTCGNREKYQPGESLISERLCARCGSVTVLYVGVKKLRDGNSSDDGPCAEETSRT